MKKGVLAFLLFIWACTLISGSVSAEGGKVLYRVLDPAKDELGPGTYTYPRHEHFAPYEGLFDLTGFTLIDAGLEYQLEFSFSKLTNPWRARYGFSHPLIQLYIDNKRGGSKELLRPGAGVQLKKGAPWDVMLHITGWWVRAFHPEDVKKLQSLQLFWDDPQNPFDVKGASAGVAGDTVKVTVPKAAVGELKGANVYVLIGSFDSFGYDYFRDVKKVSSDWAFGGAKNPDYSARVLDMLVPPGVSQKKVLSVAADDKEFATVPYVKISGGRGLLLYGVGVVLAVAAYLYTLKSKKKPISL